MPDDRESPSAGWREVCDEMDADTDVEDATHPCPDCGRTCQNVLRDVYECEEHGVFRVSTSRTSDEDPDEAESDAEESNSDTDDETLDADESDEVEHPARGPAD